MFARVRGGSAKSLRLASLRLARQLSSDGADPTPPDFSRMMNELSAKSAAAIQRRAKEALPPAHRAPINDQIGHGRVDEVQLHQLLAACRDGADDAHVQGLARELGVREGDPALASALGSLRVATLLLDPSGEKIGLWAKPNIGEFEKPDGQRR